jgi:hypothetical protein
MSADTAGPDLGPLEGSRETVREITGYWWLSLVAGIAWIVVSAVLLQFDQASVTTVGILVGLMFTFSRRAEPRPIERSARGPGEGRHIGGVALGGRAVRAAVSRLGRHLLHQPGGHVRRAS